MPDQIKIVTVLSMCKSFESNKFASSPDMKFSNSSSKRYSHVKTTFMSKKNSTSQYLTTSHHYCDLFNNQTLAVEAVPKITVPSYSLIFMNFHNQPDKDRMVSPNPRALYW